MPALRFEPGEIALLKNDDGGRLFIVHEQTEDGVVERHPTPGQQKYVDPRPTRFLVKIPSAEKAHELLGRIKQVAAERDECIRKCKATAAARFEGLWLDYGQDGEDHYPESGSGR